jgi:hypothetical protein
MFEYMASGSPIVSVAIEEARQYNDIVSIASGQEEFCRLLQWELAHDTQQRRERRIDVARQHDWQQKISVLSEMIEDTLKSQATL